MKSTIALLTLLFASTAAFAQNADPSINILMSPAVVQVTYTGQLRVDATNTAGDGIVTNSLEITISAGSNSEITGLAAGSSGNWSVFSIGAGTANTVKLRNTGGGLAAYSSDPIILTVLAKNVSTASTITGNIVYIAATNPIFNGPNASQGNTQTGNDNSTTSLTVSAGNPLPIDLTSFTGSMSNCQASLRWEVNAAKTYQSFVLEQSSDGHSFATVKSVDASGSQSSYSYSSKQDVARGFYRLKLVDRSGGMSYSNIVALTADCMQSDAGLSPNPTRGSIRLSGLVAGGNVRVYNQFGAIVVQNPRSADPAIVDLSALPAGLYRVSWETETGVVTRSVTRL